MIGDRIRALREARSWTQAHLADAAEISLRTIQRLEALHSCSPETLLALAAALDVDVGELTKERPPANAGSIERLLWLGPRPRSAAFWGALFVLPAMLFVAVNLLKFELGIAAPYDVLATMGGRLGLIGLFDSASPLILLGGPAAALVLNLAAQARPRIRREERGVAVTAISLRLDLYGLAVMVAALASLAALGIYLAGETLNDLARGGL